MVDQNDFNDSGSLADASSLKYEESSRRPSKYDVNTFEVKSLNNIFLSNRNV